MTRRERLERRLERRRDWASGAKAQATSAFGAADRAVAGIPPGQPILVGHHSEARHRRALDRHDRAMRRGVEAHERGGHHASKADGLERMLEHNIFTDDPDALEALEQRIAEREKKRERIKRFNATARKGEPDYSLLTEREKDDLLRTARVASYSLSKGGGFPRYVLANLAGRIKADRERMKSIKARAERAEQAEAAGGVLVTGDEWVAVTFAEKPDRSVLNALKAAGFWWNGGSWHGKRADLPEEVSA